MENNILTLKFNVEMSTLDNFHLYDVLSSDLRSYREMLSFYAGSDLNETIEFCRKRIASIEKLRDMFQPSKSLKF